MSSVVLSSIHGEKLSNLNHLFPLPFTYSYVITTLSTGFAYWCQTAVDDGSTSSLHTSHVDGEMTHVRSITPYVFEGHPAEVAAPGQSNTDATESCQEYVGEIPSTFVTLIAVSPDTVEGTHCIHFTENFFPSNLKENEFMVLHYENMPIQIYWKFYNPKRKKKIR